LRIALLHPTYWPEVRRGSERLIHDLGQALAGRGHEVSVLTTSPDRTSTTLEDGVRIVRSWRPPPLPGLHFYEDHVASMPTQAMRLIRGAFDIAHAFFPTDAFAALRARRLGGPPYVFSVHGILNRKHLVRRRYRLELFGAAVEGAAVTSVLSEAAAEPFRRYLLRDPEILPGGVDLRAFGPGEQRDERPCILSPASLADPRKRGPLLVEAFSELRRRRPDVELVVAGGRDPFADPALAGASPGLRIALPPGAVPAPVSRAGELAELYSRAWVTVLPSVDEAFGLVLLESLASGTPVVAARSGACPDIVDSDRVGRLFDPDDSQDLSRALDEALELPGAQDTASACRERAEAFDWSRVVERYESVYADALAGGAGG
jgi:glycosyltransferase involved in cell wall biosynthesis